MNLSALPELLVAWFKNQGAGLLQAGRGQDGAASAFKPGQQYQGQVVENLANGRSLVKVGQETLDMALPGKQARPGETVRLTFINAGPRPTFLLETAPATSGAQPVRLSEAAQQVTALMRYAQSPASPVTGASATTTLSAASAPAAPAAQASAATQTTQTAQAGQANPTAARPIASNVRLLLETGPQATNLSSAVASRVAIPAMSMSGQAVDGLRSAMAPSTHLATQGVNEAAVTDGHALPVRLRQTVVESGLFYESHLSRWARGQLSEEALLREPQARFARADPVPTGVPELRGMSDEAARMAGRQLMLLEGGPFVWLGQAWPGQDMQWLVEERPGGEAGEGDAPQWRTELKLRLPRLGDVAAELRLSAQGLRIDLNAAGEASLGEMRAALPDLAIRLRDANLNVTGLSARLQRADDATAG
jgi:hypothetical protein